MVAAACTLGLCDQPPLPFPISKSLHLCPSDHWRTEPPLTFHSFSVKEEEAWSLDCSSRGPITHVALHAKSNLYALFTQVQDGP